MKMVNLLLALGILVVSSESIVVCMNEEEGNNSTESFVASTIGEKEVIGEDELFICKELLAAGNYKKLFEVLNQAVLDGNFTQFDWAFETALDTLNVPLLHWTIYYQLVVSTGMMTTEELEAILHAITLVLVRTKMDQIVCFSIDGCNKGDTAYEMLRAQYYRWLQNRRPLLEQACTIDFSKLCLDVFSYFEDEEEGEIKQSDLLGTPVWVYHVEYPWGLFARNTLGTIIFESLLDKELGWGLEQQEVGDGIQLVPSAAIKNLRNQVVAQFRKYMEAKGSWLEFMQDSSEDFRILDA